MFASILVVCVGNICRSPIGERILAGALPHVAVGSAGLEAMVGQPADALAAEAARAAGIEVGGHVARQLTPELGSRHELILVMEREHRYEIAVRMPQLAGRTMLFGKWLSGGMDIADPYRRSREAHQETVALIRAAAVHWIDRFGQMD